MKVQVWQSGTSDNVSLTTANAAKSPADRSILVAADSYVHAVVKSKVHIPVMWRARAGINNAVYAAINRIPMYAE